MGKNNVHVICQLWATHTCLFMTSKHLCTFSMSEQLFNAFHCYHHRLIYMNKPFRHHSNFMCITLCIRLMLLPHLSLFFSLMVININKVQSLFRIIQCDLMAPVSRSLSCCVTDSLWRKHINIPISDLDYFIKWRHA